MGRDGWSKWERGSDPDRGRSGYPTPAPQRWSAHTPSGTPTRGLLLPRFGSRTAAPNGDTRSGRPRLRGSCPEPRSHPRRGADAPRAAPRLGLGRLGATAVSPARKRVGGGPLPLAVGTASWVLEVVLEVGGSSRLERTPRTQVRSAAPLARGLEAWGAGAQQVGFLTPPPRYETRPEDRSRPLWIGDLKSFLSWACWPPSSLHPGGDPEPGGRVGGVCASWGCCQLAGRDCTGFHVQTFPVSLLQQRKTSNYNSTKHPGRFGSVARALALGLKRFDAGGGR